MEEKFPVIDGAESFYFKGNEVGILVSHGFMGTPQSVRYIGEKLVQYGYSVVAPRLKGHGTHYYDLENCTYEDWFQSLEREYLELKKRCTTIFVTGSVYGRNISTLACL